MLTLRKSCKDTLSSNKPSLLLLSRKPILLNTLSAWELVAGTQRYFLAGLQNLGNCCLLSLHQFMGSKPSSRAGLCLQANNYKLQILSSLINNLVSSTSSSSSSLKISSDSSISLLLGLEGHSRAAKWLRLFASTRVLFFTAERVPILGVLIIWRLSC